MKKNSNHSRAASFGPAFILFLIIVLSFPLYSAIIEDKKENDRVTRLEKTHTTFYPVQYSDNHITSNAMVSDPRFKNISFENTGSLTKNQLANTISAVRGHEAVETTMEKGVWLWTPILQITPEYAEQMISGAKKDGITDIYLSIDSYLDIYIMPDGPEKTVKKRAFDTVIEDFILKARESGISVDAETGWRNWAEEGHQYKPLAMINYVLQYNNTHQKKFRAIQYDIEPYLLPEYVTDKKTVLIHFLDLVNQTVTKLDKSDLEFSVAIPEFYDGTNDETPKFAYKGKLGFAIEHLLDIMDRRQGSKIIIMSYRNWSKGNDGSIDITRNEIDLANKHRTKIIVAQDTSDVEPSYITFFKKSRPYYERQLQAIHTGFEKDKSFGGVAVNYLNSLLELE